MTLTDQQLRQFLLRRLPEDETRAIEDAILVESDVAERLRVQELDLFSDYAAARLSASEHADVERHLLTSSQAVHSMRIAKLLLRADLPAPGEVRSKVTGRTWYVSPPRRAAFAALMCGAILAVVLLPRWRSEPSAPPTANPTTAPTAAAAPQSVPVFTLVMDVNRGTNRPIAAWPAAPQVRLQLEVPAKVNGPFIVSIEDKEGHIEFRSMALSVRSAGPYRFVESLVPTQTLSPGVNRVSIKTAEAPLLSPPAFRWEFSAPSAH